MTDEQKRDYLEAIRDKSPVVTDAETLAVALSNIGTMSPRLRKVYDDSAALLRAQKAAIDAAVASERERWIELTLEAKAHAGRADDCGRIARMVLERAEQAPQLTDQYVDAVVRSAQPHLETGCRDWRKLTEQCRYWLQVERSLHSNAAAIRQAGEKT